MGIVITTMSLKFANFSRNLIKVSNSYKLQVACYRDPLMPHELHNFLERRKSVEIPEVDEINDEHQRYKARLRKARMWARYGNASQISPDELFPTEEEIQAENEAEKKWWPSFQQLKSSADEKIKIKQDKIKEREALIAKNMADMPRLIEKWRRDQVREEEMAEKRMLERERNKQRADEKRKEELVREKKAAQQKKGKKRKK